jgi:hypothetical protein
MGDEQFGQISAELVGVGEIAGWLYELELGDYIRFTSPFEAQPHPDRRPAKVIRLRRFDHGHDVAAPEGDPGHLHVIGVALDHEGRQIHFAGGGTDAVFYSRPVLMGTSPAPEDVDGGRRGD